MKVNGYTLREAIKRLNLELQVAKNLFNDSTSKFEGENKTSLLELSGRIFKLESDIVTLQTALTGFNTAVAIEVEGFGNVTLLKAVKLIGPIERMEILWRKLVAPKRDRYSRHEDTNSVRVEGNRYAEKTFTVEEATAQAKVWASKVTRLRAAIATMNATFIDMELEPSLFD